jgi:hypothetical protein
MQTGPVLSAGFVPDMKSFDNRRHRLDNQPEIG